MVCRQIRIDDITWKELKEIAKAKGSTASTMLREAAHEIIKTHKKGK